MTDAYVTLNGQFFCTLGPIDGGSTASCTGFVPCFLPSCATFAIMGRVSGSAYVQYSGPAVQLTPNATCNPTFSSANSCCFANNTKYDFNCPAPYSPLSQVSFDFTVSTNDNIATYSNFEIYATNPLFPSPVFVAKVKGPLCVVSDPPSTFVIANWVIPCEFNNAGLTTFTLTFTQTISGSEKILQSQTITITIGENTQCDLSLVLNCPGNCPLPYNLSDCGCLSQGTGSSLAPCGNCPACPSLACTSTEAFVPGNSLNFYIHNGSHPISHVSSINNL